MKTRIAYLGYGPRGQSLIGNLLDMDDVEITVVCELRSDRLEALQKIVEEKYGTDRLCHKCKNKGGP